MAYLTILFRNTFYLQGKAFHALNDFYFCIRVHTVEAYVALLAFVIE